MPEIVPVPPQPEACAENGCYSSDPKLWARARKVVQAENFTRKIVDHMHASRCAEQSRLTLCEANKVEMCGAFLNNATFKTQLAEAGGSSHPRPSPHIGPTRVRMYCT